MHMVSKISSSLSARASDKPILLEEFYPLPFDNYITVFIEQSIQSNTYDYFNDVIFDILPYLKNSDIKIVQITINDEDQRLINCHYVHKPSASQLAYLIKNSSLHICTDPYSNELCGIYSVPSICLVGNRFAENSHPWYRKSKRLHSVISGLAFNKPTFAQSENPKSINTIKTETVSRDILKKLNFGIPPLYKTIYTGSEYHLPTLCDIIPSHKPNLPNGNIRNFMVRFDKFFNEDNVFQFCLNNQFSISTNVIPSDSFLEATRKNCKLINLFVDSETDKDEITKLVGTGVLVKFVFSGTEVPDDVLYKFVDFGKVFPIDSTVSPDILSKSKGATFRSSLVILRGSDIYPSYAHLEKNIKVGIINETINSKLFWENHHRYKIYKPERTQK